MDYAAWYTRISAPFRGERATRALNVLDKALVFIVATAYMVTLGVLLFTGDGRFWRALIVPAATFALVTVVRQAIDAPRPYELFAIDPIIRKDTRGKSLPSRHLASAVIIACALAWLSHWAGAAAFAASAIVAFTRIVGGVHFPRDIAASIAIALACGAVGFLLVP